MYTELEELNWKASVSHSEYTLHQLSPYIGKMKSSIAEVLLDSVTNEGDTVWDPFCGAGTVALEALAKKRQIIAGDLNPLAVLLTRGKLYPLISLEIALAKLDSIHQDVSAELMSIDLRTVPQWVRSFYHPETLRETIAWVNLLKRRREPFLLAALMGILHHQRPGFLSYPSSHAVPYLRTKLFPRESHAALYEYRDVLSRLQRKIERSFRRMPVIHESIARSCKLRSADKPVHATVNSVITSPPYMRRLDYARDNRLRLWFLTGCDWYLLDQRISPSENDFFKLMRRCFRNWQQTLVNGGHCVIVVGDSNSRQYKSSLAQALTTIATKEIGGYVAEFSYTDSIPNERRVRRGYSGNETETILIFKKR